MPHYTYTGYIITNPESVINLIKKICIILCRLCIDNSCVFSCINSLSLRIINPVRLMITTIIRTVLIYLFVFAAVRLMGKRQVADMQASELVTTLIISEVASLPMQNIDQPLLSGFVPILILVAIEILLSVIMIKSKKIRGVVVGHPIVVIKDGEILKEELKALRISYEDLYSLLRQQEAFDIKNIRYAIIEPNGSLSVMNKDENSSAEGIQNSEEVQNELQKIKEKGGETKG